ncbi:AP-1 complex subunit sigma-1 [Lachnellula arida]|uniref:AP complex subunit sigma n=1 Tax=Lachnellula arida TaxID=1316785 RepID=A0A8T9BQJ7_9HELO|nr:AP-1 complex subunit sigma-1 [Lachnellula arida]
MAINYLILLSRQGKVRLAKWFTTLSPKEKAKIIKDVSQLVLARRTRMCNFLEYKGWRIMWRYEASADGLSADSKIVYRRYASLFFIAGCNSTDNELITLEIVHRYVEQMDKYYGNVCEVCWAPILGPYYSFRLYTDNRLVGHRMSYPPLLQRSRIDKPQIFNFQKAYFILDELLLAGEMQESSKKNVLRVISAQDSIEDTEVDEEVTKIM